MTSNEILSLVVVGVNRNAVLAFVLFAHVLFVHVFPIGLARGIIQSGGVEVKGLVTIVTPAILLAELILFG